jgi:hypothetical protein
MSTTPAASDAGPPPGRSLWWALLLLWSGLALLFAAYHSWLLAFIRAHGGQLGSITDWMVAPLYARWQLEWPGLRLLPALLAVGALAGAVPIILDRRCSPRRVVALGMGLFLAVGLGVSMIDGPHRYRGVTVPPFATPLAHWASDYFGDVPKVELLGPRAFLERYAQRRLFSTFASHTRSHPPGPVLFHWIVSRAVFYDPVIGALAVIAVGALALPLVYLIGRDVYGEEAARRALLLFLVTPSVIMFGVTSMDSVFMVNGLVCVWLFVRWWRGAPGVWPPLALGVALGLGTFMTYSIFFLGACLILIALLEPRHPWPRVFLDGGLALIAYLGFYLSLAWVGFQPVRALRASIGFDARLMGTGVESVGRYLNQSVCHALAFGFGLGVAIGGIWLRGFCSALKTAASRSRRDAFALASGLTLVAMIFSSLFSFEVERVWLFMVPILVLAGASHLCALERRLGGRGATYATLAVSALQLLLAETLLDTFW